MRILAIGDPHGNIEKLRRIPKRNIDLILLTGDLGKADLARKRFFENVERKKKGLPEFKDDATWAKKVHMQIHSSTINILKYLAKFAPVYTIQGNVGISTKGEVRKESKKYGIKFSVTMDGIEKIPGVQIVKNVLRIIEGQRIGFLEFYMDTSWVREFKPTDYKKKMDKAKKQTEKVRMVLQRFSDLDILVCHQPPFGFLDRVNFPRAPKGWQGKHAGGKAIFDYIKRYQPRYVFCSHIHEGKGHKRIGKTEVYNLGVAGHVIIKL